MNERLELLIQLELDGEISASERTELDAASDADPVTRDWRSRMLELGQDLDSLAWQEPSPALKRGILDELQIPATRPRATAPRPRWRVDFRQVVAFAAGIALILVVGRFASVFDESGVDPNQATGTFMTPRAAVEVDRNRLESGSSRIEAWTERLGDQLILRARGTGDATTPVRIEWVDQEWSAVAVRSVPPAILGVDRGRASFSWTASGPFTLEFELQASSAGNPEGAVRLLLGDSGAADPSITLGVVP